MTSPFVSIMLAYRIEFGGVDGAMLLQTEHTMGIVAGPLIRIIPRAPPCAVARAHIVADVSTVISFGSK
jgi:hypothetical protein